MKSIFLNMLSALLVFSISTLSFANGVATIDSRAAVLNSKQAKKVLADLQSSIEPDKQRIKKIRADVAALEKTFRQPSMTAKKKQALQAQAQEKVSQYNQIGARVQQQIEDSQSRILSELMPKMRKGIEQISKERGIGMVIDKNNVLYVSPSLDITADVTQYIDKN